MKHKISFNGEKDLANIEAKHERDALVHFSKVNMDHASKSGGSVDIKDEGHCYSYEYEGNKYSVKKFLIW